MRKIIKKFVVFMLVFSMAFSAMTAFASTDVTYLLKVYGSDFKINDGTIQSGNHSQRYAAGTAIKLTSTRTEDFLYWLDVAGDMILSYESEKTIYVNSYTIIAAVYDTAIAGETAIVDFISDSNQVIQSRTYSIDSLEEELTLPNVPNFPSKMPVGWSLDSTAEEAEEVMTLDEIIEGIESEISEGNTHITVYPVYGKIDAEYTLTVKENGETVSSETLAGGYFHSKTASETVTVTENGEEKTKTFSYWADKNGNVLSLDRTYSVFLSTDKIVYALYDTELPADFTVGTATFTKISAREDTSAGYYIEFESNRAVMEGYLVKKHGVLKTKDATLATKDSFTTENVSTELVATTDVDRAGIWAPAQGMASADTVQYYRSYMTLVADADGDGVADDGAVPFNVYGDIWSGSYNDVLNKKVDLPQTPPSDDGTGDSGEDSGESGDTGSSDDNLDVGGSEDNTNTGDGWPLQ